METQDIFDKLLYKIGRPLNQLTYLLGICWKVSNIVLIFVCVLSLCCRSWAFSSCSERGLLFITVHGLLIAVASLAEHRLQALSFQQLQHSGSVVAAHRLSCFMECEVFLDRALNSHPLHWQADTYPLYHQGNPVCEFCFYIFQNTGNKHLGIQYGNFLQ